MRRKSSLGRGLRAGSVPRNIEIRLGASAKRRNSAFERARCAQSRPLGSSNPGRVQCAESLPLNERSAHKVLIEASAARRKSAVWRVLYAELMAHGVPMNSASGRALSARNTLERARCAVYAFRANTVRCLRCGQALGAGNSPGRARDGRTTRDAADQVLEVL